MKLWGGLFTPHDSRDRESRTLFFVSVTLLFLWAAIIAVIWKFVVSSVDVMSFATAVVTLCGGVATVIGIWLGREWIRK